MDNRPVILESRMTRIRQGRYGHILYNFHDDTIGRAVDLYGEWAQAECELLGPYLSAGDTVADVGSNIGTHMLFFSEIVGTAGTVYAFEPQHEIFQIMAGNAAINGRTNVKAIRAAVGRRAGSIELPRPDYESRLNFGAISLLDAPSGASAGDSAPIVTLDSLSLRSLALLKIDVEGMELPVLQGAECTIGAFAPIIYAENTDAGRSYQVTSWLLDRGYRIFWHIAVAFNPLNFAKEVENIFGDATERNILCVPREYATMPTHLLEITDPSIYEAVAP